VVGIGKTDDLREHDWVRLGGASMGVLARGATATILLELPDGSGPDAKAAADFALGLSLRSYAFDKYKPSKNGQGKASKPPPKVTIQVEDVAATRRMWMARSEVAAGVTLARDLVNEPANVLGP